MNLQGINLFTYLPKLKLFTLKAIGYSNFPQEDMLWHLRQWSGVEMKTFLIMSC